MQGRLQLASEEGLAKKKNEHFGEGSLSFTAMNEMMMKRVNPMFAKVTPPKRNDVWGNKFGAVRVKSGLCT